MSRRREYIKTLPFESNSLKVKLLGVRNQNANADLISSEILDILAQLIQLAHKRGRMKSSNEEVYDEAV